MHYMDDGRVSDFYPIKIRGMQLVTAQFEPELIIVHCTCLSPCLVLAAFSVAVLEQRLEQRNLQLIDAKS